MQDAVSSIVAAMAAGKTYEMAELARCVSHPAELICKAVAQLMASGQIVCRLAESESRVELRRYGLSDDGQAIDSVASSESVNGSAAVEQGSTSSSHSKPKSENQSGTETRAADVYAAMKQGQVYLVSDLAKTLGVPPQRMYGFLRVLIHAGKVAKVDRRVGHGKPRPHFLCIPPYRGTSSGCEPEIQLIESHWSDRPTFDGEYSRALNAHRILSLVSRNR